MTPDRIVLPRREGGDKLEDEARSTSRVAVPASTPCAPGFADLAHTNPAAPDFAEASFVWAKCGSYPWWPAKITRDSKSDQFVSGCGKRKRFHVLYYQSWDTGWVPATRLKDFKQNLEALCGTQRTKMREGLTRAIQLATEAEDQAEDQDEASGGASAAPPPKNTAAECSSSQVRALAAEPADTSRGADTGALGKRRRLGLPAGLLAALQQRHGSCDISAAGCWERGDESAEALEWQI